MPKKVVLSLSGGMDSTTLLAYLLDRGYGVHPFTFIYGSKHNPHELTAVGDILAHYDIPGPAVIDLQNAFHHIQSNLMASGGEIPEGHYNDSNMSKTVVPGRNSIFITILAGIAESIGAEAVALAVHGGDHHIYPDCRPLFFTAMDQVVRLSSEDRVHLLTPFMYDNKTKIIATGLPMGVPYGLTRTCYKDQPVACGRCGSCQERLSAFADNGIPDPIEYESRSLIGEDE